MTRHPDDELLFDLVDGSLDDERAQQVRRHLSRCAACAAFVEASAAGASAVRDVVEPMPAELDARLHAAVRGAWRERRESIATQERAQDAASPAQAAAAAAAALADAAQGSQLPERRPPARGRRRRWLPVVAFAMLATLAGTSVLIGDDQVAPDRATDASEESAVVGSDGGMPAGDVPMPSASAPLDPAAGDVPGANEISNADAGAAAEPGAREAAPIAGDEAFDVPPVGLDQAGADGEAAKAGGDSTTGVGAAVDLATGLPIDAEPTCIATFDASERVLPTGQLATQVYAGPFGLYVICG